MPECRPALASQYLINQWQKEGGIHTSQATMSGVSNGGHVERLGQTRQVVQQNPSLGTSRFRAVNRWISGGYNCSTIKGFYGAGQEDTTRTKAFELDADEPYVLLEKDQAANPVEFILHALAACLTTSLVYQAAARGIHIESIESKLEGALDLQGFLGLSDQVRCGYQQIRANVICCSMV